MPDSRAAVSGAGARSAKSPSEQGRRHLVVNSQVKRQSRQKGECPGGFEQTAFQDAFSTLPARMRGKRKIGRFSKTLEIISLNAASQSVPVTRGQGQSPALEAYLAQNWGVTSCVKRRSHSQVRPPSLSVGLCYSPTLRQGGALRYPLPTRGCGEGAALQSSPLPTPFLPSAWRTSWFLCTRCGVASWRRGSGPWPFGCPFPESGPHRQFRAGPRTVSWRWPRRAGQWA